MSAQSPTRHVLTGLALLLATAGAVLAVTLIWPRAHAPVAGEAPTSPTVARPPMDLAAYLPDPSEYPPGFTVPTHDGGIARAEFVFTTASPGEATAAPCDPEGAMPAQPPAADTPAQLHLSNMGPPGGASLTIMIAEAGTWKDLSAIRTRLAQCPDQDSAGIKCTDTAHQPVPPVPADDLIAVESHCRGSFDFRYLTYYGIVQGRVVSVNASGDDPRPGEGVLGLTIRKLRDGIGAPR
ncbi:hypothetical protein [Mycobacteroides sp. LB1]|uniref:hypothetical protein n=1 Tax=Mycobacteroides sp. LB1 TaxID=2750814 RepID=UPI0015DDC451|nr:hypothetical protein [Mycobacteroides sp. LB1]